jgi:hypothetical protein
VEFKYTAKVLCIHRTGIVKPNTTADLINLGVAKQMLVAMKCEENDAFGGHKMVPGRDGAENKRWAALKVHNDIQICRPALKSDTTKEQEFKPGPDQLPLIIKAQELMNLELQPPILDPEEPPEPPSGEKIAAILSKKKVMQDSFDQIIDRLIDDILWGEISC